MILVGELSLWVALLMAVWAALVSFAGGTLSRPDLTESGERAMDAAAVMLLLACAGLLNAILRHDFSLAYVARNATANLPPLNALGVLVAGSAGRLLVCSTMVAVYSAVAIRQTKRLGDQSSISITAVLAAGLAVLIGVTCLLANPYSHVEWMPADGMGLLSQLQSPVAALRLLLILSAYAATIIVLAHAVAFARASKTHESQGWWIARLQCWALIVWGCSLTAIFLGMWSAYVELGTVGWPREAIWPVANPWMAASVLLLSIAALTGAVVIAFTAGASAAHGVRGHRRYGGWLLLSGALLMFVGMAGVGRETRMTLAAGDSRSVTDPWGSRWTFVSDGISEYNLQNREVTAVLLELKRGARSAGVIETERRQLIDSRGAPTFPPVNVPGIRGFLDEDVRVTLSAIRPDRSVEVRVLFAPLIRLLWLGAFLILAGGLIALWPAHPRAKSVLP